MYNFTGTLMIQMDRGGMDREGDEVRWWLDKNVGRSWMGVAYLCAPWASHTVPSHGSILLPGLVNGCTGGGA